MDINSIKSQINQVRTSQDLESLRVKYLGRSGFINQQFSRIKSAPNPKEFGASLNSLKSEIENLISQKSKTLPKKNEDSRLKIEDSNFSFAKIGHLHPLTQTERQLNALFKRLGFSIYDGPVIETDEFNFARLNVPPNHPARDMQDSIYIQEPKFLLRTQTSSIESRLLATEKPPFKVAFPGTDRKSQQIGRAHVWTPVT